MAQPNFLFILIDDLGWRDSHWYGSPFYETPRIDQLGREGLTFTDAYAACPVCSPTRASILTGKYPARLGLTNFIGGDEAGRLLAAPYLRELPVAETTVATALRAAGYRTYHVGKWHLGGAATGPEQHGFEVNVGGSHWGQPAGGYFSPYGMPKLADGPAGEYLTDRLTDEAIRLLAANGDRPFFMHLAHYAVHIPIQVPAASRLRFEQKARDFGLDQHNPFAEGNFFPCEHKKNQRIVRRLFQSDPAYAGMIANLDDNIGRVLDALESLGLADNTVVVFTSDNGGLATAEGSPTCNAPLSEGKGWMYEGGTRVPLLIRWPAMIAPGSRNLCPVASPDFFPTFLAAAAVPLPPGPLDGCSLLPLLRGESALARDAIFWHYPHYGNQGGTPGSSVRCGDYKLIEFFEENRLELYNLREDIGENQNLIADSPIIVRELHALLRDWRRQVAAKMPTPNPDYRLWR